MIIVTEATKGKSKKQFQHGVRFGFFSATVPKKKKCKRQSGCPRKLYK